MSNPSPVSQLGTTAIEAVKALFYSVFTRTLDARFVDFSLDAAASELVIVSKDESSDGQVGRYRGSYRWPYTKANLNSLVPYPLAVQAEYPMTFRQLRSQLMTRYNIFLEENEFSLTTGNNVGLVEDSVLATPLMNAYGQFSLYATVNSGRFVAGSSLTMIFVQPNRRIPLRALFDLKAPNILGELASA